MWAAVIIAVAIAAVLVLATMRADDFRVARSITINASPERIFPLINDIKTLDTWNPFARQEGVKSNYSGPAAGPGATNAFSGSGGTGRLSIVSSKPPSEVVMQLVMEKPIAGDNHIVFSITPAGQGANAASQVPSQVSSQVSSKVSWSMSGRMAYIAKVIGLFVSMDVMIGGQFEKGLRDLKVLAEK